MNWFLQGAYYSSLMVKRNPCQKISLRTESTTHCFSNEWRENTEKKCFITFRNALVSLPQHGGKTIAFSGDHGSSYEAGMIQVFPPGEDWN